MEGIQLACSRLEGLGLELESNKIKILKWTNMCASLSDFFSSIREEYLPYLPAFQN
jgi:hypothetical protein